MKAVNINMNTVSWLVVSRLYSSGIEIPSLGTTVGSCYSSVFNCLWTYAVPLDKMQVFSLLNFDFEVLQNIVDPLRVDTYFTNPFGM